MNTVEPTTRTLQEQIVALRMQIETMSSTQATLIEHFVVKAVAAEVGDRLPPEEHTRWLADQYAAAQERRRQRNELALHLLKLGIAGCIGFILWATWEATKSKITGKPPFGGPAP